MKEQNSKIRERSRLSSFIVVLLCAIPPVASIAYGAVDPVALGGLFVWLSVILLLWMADSLRSGQFEFSTNLLQLPLLGVVVIAAIQLLPLRNDESVAALLSIAPSTALSLDPYSTRFFLIQLVIYLVFFAAALVYIRGDRRPVRIGIGIVAFGALIAFFGILQRLSMPDAIYGLRPTPQAIPFGPYVNQHHFAALMQMTSGVALGLLFGSGIGRERKVIVGLAAGVMGMAVVFTGSRGGLISYLFVVAFAAIASLVRVGRRQGEDADIAERRKRNLLVTTAAGGLVVLVLGSVLMLGGEGSLLRGIGLQYDPTDITSGRSHFWSVAWKIFMDNPVIGAGFDSFSVAFTRFDTWSGLYRLERAHNDYLQMLAEGGVIGFACVVAFVLLFVRQGVAAIGGHRDRLVRSIVTGSFAGCLGIMVHSFFDFPLRTPANAFFFLLLVVLVVGNSRESATRG